MRKAYTAAALPRSTGETADLAYSNPERRPSGIPFCHGSQSSRAGLPIMRRRRAYRRRRGERLDRTKRRGVCAGRPRCCQGRPQMGR
jgi:hypothetical protein